MTTITIPQTPEELAELLADDSRRSAVFADATTTHEFLAAYTKAVNKGDVLSRQISEQVTTTLTDMLKDWGVKGRPDLSAVKVDKHGVPVAKGTGAIRNAAHNPGAPGASIDGQYTGLGEMALDLLRATKGHDPKNIERWRKVIEITNAYSSIDPATGGFLIPEEMRSDIMQLTLEMAMIRPRATVITLGSLTTSIPYVDETTHVGSVYGGMVFSWQGEDSTITPSNAKFGRLKLEANKLVGGASVPNELFSDAPALSTWLEQAAPSGLAFFEDLAFVNGSGSGEPLGFRRSPAMITVAKETGQPDSTIVSANVLKMYSRMLPQSLGRAVWLTNQTTFEQLASLSIDVGTGGAPVALVNIHASPTPTLLGRPLFITEKVPALGSEGDLNFVDLGFYVIGDRQAVSIDASEHSRFMSDETEIRVIQRADGRPWVMSPITPVNGDSLSPFVQLGARTT